MKSKTSSHSRTDLSMKLNIAILVVFSVLIIWCIILVRDKLLLNADEMATNLAESYAREEENRISIYRMFLNLGSVNLNELLDEKSSPEEIQQWIALYSSHLSTILGSSIIDPYAVIDGQIIAAVPWEGDGQYDYANTSWYQQAISADGESVFTDAYTDVITGKQLVTLAKKIDDNNNVLAFDILLDNFHAHQNQTSMPEDSSYFLYDSAGALIYVASDLDMTRTDAKDYAGQLLESIREGRMESHSSYVTDPDGRKRGVYYYTMKNGWTSVITIPIENILHENWNYIVVILAAIFVALFITMTIVVIRGYFGSQKMQHIADTLQILGDTYYAIYRVNYVEETYESIKSSPDVRAVLGESGSYEHLADVITSLMADDAKKDFAKSFSLANIRDLVRKKVYEFDGDYKRRFEDDYKWVSIKAIYNQALNLDEVIICFREIDKEKEKQLRQHLLLENALEASKQTADRKNSFFSSVSHDMRTPLNAIIGLSELAQKNKDDSERVNAYMQKIETSGRQLLTLVNDILDMSRLEHGANSSLDYKPMDLCSCIKDCVDLFYEQAQKEKKTLHLDTDVNVCAVLCDPFRLSQIMNNLLSNAFKYSLEGADITVSLKQRALQGSHGKYQISVSDTGIGMSQEFLDQVFDPFTRETRFTPTSVTGTGLGMPIVKSLVQQMSGEITVQSELGQGTTFTVTLPLQTAGEKLPAPPSESVVSDDLSLSGRKILLAEDNEINMEITTEGLSLLGAEVLQAWNGKEALDLFCRTDPGTIDAILMDMQMPVMDGCTASSMIRDLDRSDAGSVPIIAVTANAFAEDIARTTAAGMNAHVSKPIDFHVLTTTLVKYMK